MEVIVLTYESTRLWTTLSLAKLIVVFLYEIHVLSLQRRMNIASNVLVYPGHRDHMGHNF